MTDKFPKYINGRITFHDQHKVQFVYLEKFKNNDDSIEIECPIIKNINISKEDKLRLMEHNKIFHLHCGTFFDVKMEVTKEIYKIIEIY